MDLWQYIHRGCGRFAWTSREKEVTKTITKQATKQVAQKTAQVAEKALVAKTGQAATHGVKGCEFIYKNSAGVHLNELVRRGANIGRLSRPYMRSPLTIKEITSTGKGIPDATAKGALNYRVPGTFRNSSGIWELVVDQEQNLIYHFNFTN